MGSTSDPATSLTLLNVLCGSEKDEAAWQLFYLRYQPMICRWSARHHLQDADVEDVSQKVLQRVFSKINTFNPGKGGFRGWLKTVVDNAVKDFMRDRGRRPGDQGSGNSDMAKILQAIAQPETIDLLVQDLDTSLRRDLDEILAQVEKEMTPESMRAFRLRVLEGKSLTDVAAQLGKSYAAVCQLVSRVKKKLRTAGARLGAQAPNAQRDPP